MPISNSSQPPTADVNAKSKDGWTPLHWAVWRGSRDVVQLLLANKAEVNTKSKDDWRPLNWAKTRSVNPSHEFGGLLEKKVLTPLHVAVWSGHKNVTELLLASKEDINAKDNDGSTPLHLAARKDYKNLAELLLANKADINAKDNNGFTPLHLAAKYVHKDVVELLLQHGARE
jgi:ankyrin repeat protein